MRVVCGPMFAGKTRALKNSARAAIAAGLRVVILSPEADTRRPLYSHDGSSCEDLLPLVRKVGPTTDYDDTTRGADVVLCDEAQLFSPELVDKLSRDARRVEVFGVDMNFRGRGFFAMPELLARATSGIVKLVARCGVCGADAPYTCRLSGGEEEVLIGEAVYSPRCERCFVRPAPAPMPG